MDQNKKIRGNKTSKDKVDYRNSFKRDTIEYRKNTTIILEDITMPFKCKESTPMRKYSYRSFTSKKSIFR